MSPKVDDDEERVIHSKSDNIKTVINDEAERVIERILNHSKIDIKII